VACDVDFGIPSDVQDCRDKWLSVYG
jgi:hypothetical protein